MLLAKLKNKLSFKNRYINCLILVLVIFILIGVTLTFYKIKGPKFTQAFTSNKGEWIVITISNSQNKNDLWLINTKTQAKKKLLENKDVVVTGKVNSSGNTLLYSDAIGTNPWDIYKLDIKKNDVYQITNDPLGQFNVHFGNQNANIIFAKSGGKSSPIPQISKIDIIRKEGQTFELGADIGVQDFDVQDNKIIALTFPFNEFLTKRIKEQNNSTKIKYSIIEMDFTGNIIKRLSEVSAIRLDSISFSKSGNDAILSGRGLLKKENGFYKLNLKDNKITTLVTEDQLKETNKISQLSQPYTACLSSDEKNIYFVAMPTGTKEKNFFGITVNCNTLYCYNLEKRTLTEVFKKPDTFISSMSFTYQ